MSHDLLIAGYSKIIEGLGKKIRNKSVGIQLTFKVVNGTLFAIEDQTQEALEIARRPTEGTRWEPTAGAGPIYSALSAIFESFNIEVKQQRPQTFKERDLLLEQMVKSSFKDLDLNKGYSPA
jgi:hypothetical protein